MARTVLVLNNPVIKVADTEGGLTTGVAYECQLTSAVLTASANYQTIPPTGCAPQAQSPGRTSWSFDIAWLQDWTVAGGNGLSEYAMDNDGQAKWVEFTADSVNNPTVKATANCYVAAGSYGGTFGDGSAATATASWPCLDSPTIVAATTAAAATSSEPESETEQPVGSAA